MRHAANALQRRRLRQTGPQRRPKPTPREASSRFAYGLIAGVVVGFGIEGIAEAKTIEVGVDQAF
jgi:hypothetical protein